MQKVLLVKMVMVMRSLIQNSLAQELMKVRATHLGMRNFPARGFRLEHQQ
jgi:hypothetical protein